MSQFASLVSNQGTPWYQEYQIPLPYVVGTSCVSWGHTPSSRQQSKDAEVLYRNVSYNSLPVLLFHTPEYIRKDHQRESERSTLYHSNSFMPCKSLGTSFCSHICLIVALLTICCDGFTLQMGKHGSVDLRL